MTFLNVVIAGVAFFAVVGAWTWLCDFLEARERRR